jgi:hypothetical protein
VTLNGFSMRFAVSRGYPKGGVLLPLQWCLVDDLIARLSGGGITIQGYVDDICLLSVVKFPNTVSRLMQWVLRTVETWCNEVGLSVNPDKTELVVFTRKRKFPGFSEPHFFGVTLCHSVCHVSQGSPGFSADLEGACGCHSEEGSQSVSGPAGGPVVQCGA